MADGDDVIPLADEEEPPPGSAPEDEPESAAPPSSRPVGSAPLPRLWKVAPEPDDATPRRKSRRERLAEEKAARAGSTEAPATVRKAPAPARPRPSPAERPPGKVLLEDTPESETYEARRRARLIIGSVMLGAVALGIYAVVRAVGGGGGEPVPGQAPGVATPGPPLVTPAPGGTTKPPAALEQEAKILLGTAQQLAKVGNTAEAVATLEKLVKDYPRTATADEAREALGRPSRNLPLFLDKPAVVASPTPAAPKPAGPPPVVVEAAPAAPAVATGASPVARLDLPANPAEPPRAPTPANAGTPPKSVASKAVPAGFHARTEAGLHASGWPNQITSDRDGATMVLVPAGTFLQGRDDGPPQEAPEHKVTLGTFYIDQHEVTVQQYNLYLRETNGKLPSQKQPKSDAPPPADPEQLPVVNVTALEAKDYCAWAGKRLPTEAQWEAAARTTDGRLHPWGAQAPKWTHPRVPRQIDPVMTFPTDQSPYGAFDMVGNAWEFTKDWYDPNYYYQFRGRTIENPTGPDTPRRPPQVVVKGVSKAWYASGREGLKIDTRFPYVGFRGVLAVESVASTPNVPGGGNEGGGMQATPGGIVPF